jgi:hypothetical protein
MRTNLYSTRIGAEREGLALYPAALRAASGNLELPETEVATPVGCGTLVGLSSNRARNSAR